MKRYSVITDKNPREIVLLRGGGCKWKKCTFCDYHLDCSDNEIENFDINKKALENIKGIYKNLEVINSGSFTDLDNDTMQMIIDTCKNNGINNLHFECHYIHRQQVKDAKILFAQNGIGLKIKTGVETFDVQYRENVMKKGFGFATPSQIAKYADDVCLLFGLSGQNYESMKNDIDTGLLYFERVCVNIMTENSTNVKPDNGVINTFVKEIYPIYKDNDRVDILLNNTDFGVGAPDKEGK